MGLAFVVYRMNRRQHGYWEQSAERLIAARVIAGMSLPLWMGVLLGGRWIAYLEYVTDPFHVPFVWEDLGAYPPIIRSLSYARPHEGSGESARSGRSSASGLARKIRGVFRFRYRHKNPHVVQVQC